MFEKKKKQDRKRRRRKLFNARTFIVIMVAIGYIISAVVTALDNAKLISGQVSYDEFMELIDSDKVDYIQITKDSDKFFIKCTDGRNLESVNPKSDDFIEQLYKKNVDIKIQQKSVSNSLLSLFMTLPFMVFLTVLICYVLTSYLGGNTKAFTLIKHTNNKVSFDDIRGLSETKKEIQFIIEQFKNWKELGELGARVCRGVLLYGPPGTGKTMLAKAIAKEAKVSFISCSGSDFNEVFVGVGASRVRQLFELAEFNAPCIIFIDEIDCLGKRRRGGDGVANELNQTLNALLQRMDGINTVDGVLVIGATNKKDYLDDALLRPGRFDRQYFIGPPDNKKDRDSIVEIYLENKKLEPSLTLNQVSKLVVGLTGAEIENVINEAVYSSLLDGREGEINLVDIDEAVMKQFTSGVKKDNPNEEDKKLTAIHESGHTLVSLLLNIPISKVSIVEYSSGVGGVTIRDLDILGDRKFRTMSEYEDDIKVLLAGKVAEEVLTNEHSQGCSNDLEKATNQLLEMYMLYGYDDSQLVNEKVLIENNIEQGISEKLLQKVNSTLSKLNEEVLEMLNNHRKELKNLSERLYKSVTIVSPTIEFVESLDNKE